VTLGRKVELVLEKMAAVSGDDLAWRTEKLADTVALVKVMIPRLNASAPKTKDAARP